MGISKRLEQARRGYTKNDKNASAGAHDPEHIADVYREASEEHGGSGSKYIGDFIFGGLDGIITTFAVVSGVVGANLGSNVILILGLANLLADGFSMAVGAYLSSKSENEYYQKERQRELWEVENYPEGEKAELYEIYLQKGYTPAEADQLLAIHTRSKERWVSAMMIDELGMLEDDRSPITSGIITFIAFLIAGTVPLLVYLAGLFLPIPSDQAFMASILLSGIALFCLGAGKVFVTHQNPIRSGLEMLLVGGLAAGVAYAVGALLRSLGL